MDLLEEIVKCSDDEVDGIIKKAIEEADKNANKVEHIGMYQDENFIFKGFIPLKSKIKYMISAPESYSMETTDFIFEFAHFIRDYNLNSKQKLVYGLEPFINKYFGHGVVDKAGREKVFNQLAWQNSQTDDEFFELLEKNKIGDLKEKSVAQCTERAAVAQQILSLFGIESYYCFGCVDINGNQEGHSYNITKGKNGNYILLDYSVPVKTTSINGVGLAPFMGNMTEEEFKVFVNHSKDKGKIVQFDDYEICDNEITKKSSKRKYVVGEFEIMSEDNINQ